MTDLIGFIGAALSAYSGIPQARRSYLQGHSRGVEPGLIVALLAGVSCFWVYVLGKYGYDWVLHTQHTITISTWLVILKYKYFERGPNG